MPPPANDPLSRLQTENQRLVQLLESHGINWRNQPAPHPPRAVPTFTTTEKIALFRSLFRGRIDVYPVRWESRSTGKSGYAPACANEWVVGICEKPRIKCADCGNRSLLSLSDNILYDHLAGSATVGIYPLLQDDRCHFLAVDFDEAEWREDAKAYFQSCQELGVPAALEISRSGNGAHVWIFFASAVLARDARRLGTALISHTCARTRQLTLKSYDRLFPNQDAMPPGGFGNLIALPLQKRPREQGFSVFVDDQLRPYVDQWAFLASVQRIAAQDIAPTIVRATGGVHPLDVVFMDEEDLAEPWNTSRSPVKKLDGPMPKSVKVTLANMLYFEKADLPQSLANRLIRLAAFQNPAFYKAQAMRFSVWDIARVIGCAENYPQHIGLPRGCLEAAFELLEANGIATEIQDKRILGATLDFHFRGVLRPDQHQAVEAMTKHDTGVLCAPTAFGKTVAAAALVALRGVSTLILVHRTELLRQWQERLLSFLNVDKGTVGTIGGGKSKPSGKIDIAVMQSLSRQGKVHPLVETYGHVIIDECHHVGAVSFDAILKRVKAKYVLGLTATPIRRDGQQPIIFMQCGPTRHTVAKSEGALHDLAVIPTMLYTRIALTSEVKIQDVFSHLVADTERTAAIANAIREAVVQGRKVLVLTERNEHLGAIRLALGATSPLPFVLHGKMSKKQRTQVLTALTDLPPHAPRILLSTGRLVGEGFDHPPLDTLVLAMPVSWKGTLQQYAGRLHRDHAHKTNAKIIDFVDADHPALLRMWQKRQQGYRAMGYRLVDPGQSTIAF